MRKDIRSFESIRREMVSEPRLRTIQKILAWYVPAIGMFILLQVTSSTWAEEILVVTGKTAPVNSLNRTETANLFLGLERTTPSLIPYDQTDKTLRKDFYREVAGRSLASVRAHWAKRVFTGRGRPPAMLAADEVDRTIEQNPDAVTYVPDVRQPKKSKVLLYLPRDIPQ